MWVLAAMFSMQLVQGKQQADQLKTQNKTAKLNAKIQDQLTQASNSVAAAQGALQRFKQSSANQQILQNAANYNEALGKNLTRLQDQSTQGTFNTRVQAAERTGQLVAAASSAGIGGSTIDQLNQVIRGQAARAVQVNERNRDYATSDALERMKQVTSAGILGQQDITFIDRVTQVQHPENQVEVPSLAQIAGQAALSTFANKAGMDALGQFGSTFFKSTPQTPQISAEGFNPAPGTINSQSTGFFNVANMFGQE